MDEPTLVQQLTAEVIGTTFLVFIGVGTLQWAQLPAYLLAELAAGVAAALVYTVISRTPADTAPATDTAPVVPDPAHA